MMGPMPSEKERRPTSSLVRAPADGPSEHPGARLLGPGGLELRLDSREVTVGDAASELTPQEFAVLRLLLERVDEVVTADELAEGAWGHPLAGNRSFLDSLISRLRRDLRGMGLDNVIRTIRGIGYRIAMPARTSEGTLALSGLIESIQTAVILLSRHREVLFANGAAESLTGYHRRELHALPTISLITAGEDVPYWETLIEDCLGGDPRSWTGAVVRHKDGTHIPACVSLQPAYSGSETEGVTGVIFELYRPPIGGLALTDLGQPIRDPQF